MLNGLALYIKGQGSNKDLFPDCQQHWWLVIKSPAFSYPLERRIQILLGLLSANTGECFRVQSSLGSRLTSCKPYVGSKRLVEAAMFSSVPRPTGSSEGHERRFSTDPLPVFSAGDPCQQGHVEAQRACKSSVVKKKS